MMIRAKMVNRVSDLQWNFIEFVSIAVCPHLYPLATPENTEKTVAVFMSCPFPNPAIISSPYLAFKPNSFINWFRSLCHIPTIPQSIPNIKYIGKYLMQVVLNGGNK